MPTLRLDLDRETFEALASQALALGLPRVIPNSGDYLLSDAS